MSTDTVADALQQPQADVRDKAAIQAQIESLRALHPDDARIPLLVHRYWGLLRPAYTDEQQARMDDEEERERFAAAWTPARVPKRHATTRPCGHTRWMLMREHVISLLGQSFIVVILGGRGLGKTQLAVEVIREACRRNMTCRYATAMDFFMDLKSATGRWPIRAVVADYRKWSLLVIDEIHIRGQTTWEDKVLTDLIDKRYGDKKATIVISNQNRASFRHDIGENTYSRIIETGFTIECDWPSYRNTKGKE